MACRGLQTAASRGSQAQLSWRAHKVCLLLPGQALAQKLCVQPVARLQLLQLPLLQTWPRCQSISAKPRAATHVHTAPSLRLTQGLLPPPFMKIDSPAEPAPSTAQQTASARPPCLQPSTGCPAPGQQQPRGGGGWGGPPTLLTLTHCASPAQSCSKHLGSTASTASSWLTLNQPRIAARRRHKAQQLLCVVLHTSGQRKVVVR